MTPLKTLFISAGAGSGKTYRLTNDLADYLSATDKNHHNPGLVRILPSEVIATTFTKSAAAEIKERARQELLLKDKVQEATLLETSSIGTIHSVAERFLGKYWYILGLCPNQDVITDDDQTIYRNQSLATLFNGGAYSTELRAIRAYFDEFHPQKPPYAELDPEFWANAVDKIVRKATYYGITSFSQSISQSCSEIDKIFRCPVPVTDADYATLTAAIKTALTNRGTVVANGELKKIQKLPSAPTYYGLVTLYGSITAARTDASPLTAEESQLITLLRSTQYGTILKQCVEAVFTISAAWLKQYEDFKRSRGVIDYDDMEKGLYRLIRNYDEPGIDPSERIDNSEVLREIRSAYKLILVDEFQDCNPIQLKIFTRLSEIIAPASPLPYSSIWVGDPNQSIYGFRGSDTDLINRVGSLFTAKYPATTAQGLSIDALDTSYRSREQLVDYADDMFQAPFFKEFTRLGHNPNSLYRPDKAILQWEFRRNSDKDSNYIHSLAIHLKDIVENKKFHIQPKDKKPTDPEPLRPIQYRDIAILCRRHADINKYVSVLREEGIPVSAPEAKIIDRAEVQLVLAILNLSNKGEERPHELATLLRLWNNQSTEDILSERAQALTSGTDWSAQHTTDIDPIRLALKHTRKLPLDERITSIILQLDLYDHVSKWGSANVRRQNLMTLQTVAQEFVARSSRLGTPPTEKEFTLYLSSAEIKPQKDTTADSVKVITYHGSKGLEWPMVILASLDNQELNLNELAGGRPLDSFFTREYFGPHEIMTGANTGIERQYYIHYFPAPCAAAIAPIRPYVVGSPVYQAAKLRTTEEAKRLFYVGLTRARDFLVYLIAPYYKKPDRVYHKEWKDTFCWLMTMGLSESSLEPRTIQEFPPRVSPTLSKVNSPGKTEASKKKYKEYTDSVEANARDEAAEQKRRAELKNRTYQLHDIKPLAEQTDPAKYIHPSELPRDSRDLKSSYTFQPVEGALPVDIPERGPGLWYDDRDLGSCIHNIFAACPDTLIQNHLSLITSSTSVALSSKNQYITVAKTIIRNYGLEQVISDAAADQLIHNLLAMFRWLEQDYGPATQIVHEYPFNYPYDPDSHLTPDSSSSLITNHSSLIKKVVRGEIDLVYCTPHTDIIIDFKNYKGNYRNPDVPADLRTPADLLVPAGGVHYVGNHYVAQLKMYQRIWHQANPDKDIKTFLYYDILGGVVEV